MNAEFSISRKSLLHFLFVIISLSFTCSTTQTKNSSAETSLVLTNSIQLPNVNGRIDHLAYNSKLQAVYVAALGNNTVEVVDLRNKKVIHSIEGLGEPQGIKYIPESNVIIVANGANGDCDVFDANSFQRIKSFKLNGDADNVRYDPVAGRIYIGYGNGGIAIIDSKTFRQLADIKLPGHPESFQLDNVTRKIFVNIPDAQLLVTIYTDHEMILDKWKINPAKANFPMAFDSTNHRLFIGCRNPAKLLVINSETGKSIGLININNDTDDIFFDSSLNLIYVSCGGGYIDIIKQINPDKYEVISSVESRPGARTSLFVPELNQLIVAAPARAGKDAQLMIYEKR
jgi:YVTN family beta-propeller protein